MAAALSPSKLSAHAAEGNEPLAVNSLPDALIAKFLEQLPQRQKAAAALVCRRWATVVRCSHNLFRSMTFTVCTNVPLCVERTESFIAWLVPRAGSIRSLTLLARRSPTSEAPSNPLVFSNIVAALSVVGPHLRQLNLDWPEELVLSGWLATMTGLQVGTFRAAHVVIRPGLNTLTACADLRFQSASAPLTFVPAHAAHGGAGPAGAAGLLPAGLRKLRLEGCNLTALPPAVAGLPCLEDLVLSDNNLRNCDLAGLARLTTLRQLTLMGCRMRRLPPALAALTNLQVLYLDMGLEAPAGEAPPSHLQLGETLGQLDRLSILSLGACHLQEFPLALTQLPIKALYIDDNAISVLPDGPYLSSLLVLGVDFQVLLRSHGQLARAPRLRKLCLMSPGKGVDTAPHSAEDVAAVVASVASHPRLRQVLLPMLDGARMQLFVAVLNVVIGLSSQARHLDVRAVTYQQIGNEWLEWLDCLEQEAAVVGRR